MIPIVYFRSSSFNCHRFCPMQYYLEYTLGWRGKSGQKADKGTIVHKALEICAVCKKGAQDGKKTITDDIVGKVATNLYEPEYLETIIEKVYKYYTEATSHHTWTLKDLKDCTEWTWKALRYNEGMFDPRNRDVVDAEPHFDITIDQEWAKYSYNVEGEKVEGQLALKGTVDLVTDLGDNVYEIIDWKTGKRLDWATGEEKTQEKLFNDAQLRIYHYAMKHLYPHVDTFLVTIYFINDGGAFTIHLQNEDLPKTEEMLKKKFKLIKETERPNLVKSWKCSKLCHQGKSTFEDTDIDPLIERRSGYPTRYGEYMTKCEQTNYMIKEYGIEWVTENIKSPDHVIGKYKAPGEV